MPGTVLTLPLQNEYAQIMHKRVAEEKAKQAEMRKRRMSSMRIKSTPGA